LPIPMRVFPVANQPRAYRRPNGIRNDCCFLGWDGVVVVEDEDDDDSGDDDDGTTTRPSSSAAESLTVLSWM